MAIYHVQNVLNGGEISPLCRARAEQDRYKSGCETLRNFLPMPQGGVTRRPGMTFLGTSTSGSRLIPFQFSETQGRVLEFGNYQMRVWMPNGEKILSNGRELVVSTPYPTSALKALRFAQSADVIYFAHEDYAPRKLSRYGDTDWRWSTVNFAPSIAAPGGVGCQIVGTGTGSTTSTSTTGSSTTTTTTTSTVSKRTYQYCVTAVSEDTGQESQASSATSVTGESLTSAYGVRISWNAVSGASEYRVYKLKGGIFGFIGHAKGRTFFEDYNIIADDADTPPTYNQPFSGANKYPSLVFFYQGRLGWAASKDKPMTVWMSRSGELESLGESVVPKSDDCIEVTMAATQANGFCWLKPDRTGLCIGTTGNEWTLTPAGSGVLTPSNPTYNLQTSVGGERMDPLLVSGSVVYVQRGGNSIRAFAYSYGEDKYVGQDLNILSRHILKDVGVEAWCYQQEPYSIIWMVLSDGTAASCTLMIDQQVCGWAVHETDGVIKDVTSIPGTPDDQVWFLVERTVNGVKKLCVERLGNYFDSDELAEANFLDSSLVYEGTATKRVTGLTHLAGSTVTVFADGATVQDVHVAADGSFTIPVAARTIAVGLPFTSLLRPSRPETDTQAGSTIMHNRKISSVRVRIYRSMTFEMGLDNGYTWPVMDRQVNSRAFSPDPYFTDGVSDLSFVLAGGWSADNVVRIKVDTPTPLTVLAIQSAMDVSQFNGK